MDAAVRIPGPARVISRALLARCFPRSQGREWQAVGLEGLVLATTAVFALVVAVLANAAAANPDFVINNGDDCSNPDNVIDDLTFESQTVHVRNVGCPPGWPSGNPDDPCPSPGDATEVCVQAGGDVDTLAVYDSSSVTVSGGDVHLLYAWDSSTATTSGGLVRDLYAWGSSTVTIGGGTVGWYVQALDSSSVTMSGGEVWDVYAWGSSTVTVSGGLMDWLQSYDSSTVTMNGGEVWELDSYDSSNVTISGGTLDAYLLASDYSTITVSGFGFHLDGNWVPYDNLPAETGTLTGILASRDPIDVLFYQGGGSHTGTIFLARPLGYTVPALSSSGKLALATALVGSTLLWRRRLG